MSSSSKLAVVFPGQGSQSLGMMDSVLEKYPDINNSFAIASDILGYDLLEIITSDPEEKLNQTEITQPALLVSAYAIWSAWCKNIDVKPTVLAGHSLGEYTALVCADVISFEDSIALVAERGRCMQRAVPNNMGAMAAILGLDDAQIVKVCNDSAED